MWFALAWKRVFVGQAAGKKGIRHQPLVGRCVDLCPSMFLCSCVLWPIFECPLVAYLLFNFLDGNRVARRYLLWCPFPRPHLRPLGLGPHI